MSHRITVLGTTHEFTAEPYETILDAALRSDLIVPYSCRSGMCGSCHGHVVEGEIAYPNDQLPPGLDPEQAKNGESLFCQAQARSDLKIKAREIFTAGEIHRRILPARIESLTELNHDVLQLNIRLPGAKGLEFKAGQYVDFLMKDGQRRSFSLANYPGETNELSFHVRKVPDGQFTGWLFDERPEKAIMRIEGPLGTFFLREDSQRPVLLIAGGTGFAPIRSLFLNAIEKDKLGSKRPVSIYWGVREQRDLYSEEPGNWAEEHDFVSFEPVASDAGDDDPIQRRGWVHEAVLADHPNIADYDVYLCGPPPMIQAASDAFEAAGLPEAQLHFDSFEFSHS